LKMFMNDKKLKIAMLSAHSCPVGDLGAKDTGGMSVYIRELARELGKLGHTVDIYTRIHDPADALIEHMGPGAHLIHLKAGKPATIRKIDVYHSLPEFIRNLERFWQVNNRTYDIVFSHYWISALAGKYIQDKYKIPYISMYHTLGAIKNAIGIGDGEPELRIQSERETIQGSQKVIVATEKEKKDVSLYYGASPDKISVVPCGVNMDLFRPYNKASSRQKLGLQDEKILLFVGRIDPLKGIDRLLKAIPLLENSEKLRVIIIGGDAGSQAEVEKLRKLAVELGIAERITFQGIVRQEELPYYYCAADVCVVPSYYESFGLVPLESLACGTPVVAANVGDLKNIIEHGETGYIVPENSPEQLACGISVILNNPPEKAYTAVNIRASVNRFGWGNISQQISEEMQSVLDGWLTPVA
jgi:D-inositol-3-phosphate glycosyltransferase